MFVIEYLSAGVWHRAQSAGSMTNAMWYANMFRKTYNAVRITQGGATVYSA